MSSHNGRKINQLLKGWPKETAVTKTHLDKLGIYRQLVAKYVHYNWVERLGTGAYTRSGDTVNWRGGVYALQSQLDMTIHVGGQTALGLQGRSHFIPLGPHKKVILISDRPEHLPAWFRKHQWGVTLEHRCFSLFEKVPGNVATELNCGGFEILMSSAEQAIMEQMRLVNTNDDIMHVYQLMEGLGTLRPAVVQNLLENCRSIKVKRLFLWNAEESGHAWFARLDTTRVDLGTGKRQLYKGGSLNEKYQITVPRKEELQNV